MNEMFAGGRFEHVSLGHGALILRWRERQHWAEAEPSSSEKEGSAGGPEGVQENLL